MNRRSTPCSVALALGLVFLLAGCGSATPFAAKVDGITVSQDDLEAEMRFIAANEPYLKSIESRVQVRGSGQGTFDAAFTGQVLGRQIQYVLVDREIERRKIVISPSELTSARTAVTEQAGGEEILKGFPKEYQDTLVERAARVDALTVALAGSKATGDEAAKAYYDSHKDEFSQACVSHILVASKEKADQVKGRLAGGEDFAAVARAESRDTQSKDQNGELGCEISADTVSVPEFVQAVMSQPINEVGNPVQTQFGFHLIKVTSRTVPPFDKVVAQARERVVTGSRSKLQDWLNGAVEKAKITVNPKYGTFDKKALTVVPPAAPSTTVAPQSSTPPGSGIQPLRP
ncbi:MAG: peptidylprolyl isomerase [Actinobacteria bacterium]|nr:peptidylprolyl isomerase [Actinomycetota bacterium]